MQSADSFNFKSKDEDIKTEQVKTELERYMFYYHRYEAHHNAWKIADQQKKTAERKAEEIFTKFHVRTQDTQFLLGATTQLLKNRQILSSSYIYGYYLEPTKEAEKNLFEYLQEDLEKHTDYLSSLYERPLDQIKDYGEFIAWKEQVTNYTRVTAQFLEKFVEGVMTGLTVI